MGDLRHRLAGVIGRTWRLPEWLWAVGGASLLIVWGLLPIGMAASAVVKGADVYLFLPGMMRLSETAHAHGLFDWAAATATAVNPAAGSRPRLFLLIYATGVMVAGAIIDPAGYSVSFLTLAAVAAVRFALYLLPVHETKNS